jgi:hypothetical protein
MIRLEFIKGVGGVVNLVNGTLKEIDRAELQNIEDIDAVIVDFHEALAINKTLKALEIAGYIVIFDTLESLQLYIDQVALIDGEVFNPGRDGIRKPVWDSGDVKLTPSKIVPHTYIRRDVEKELIENNHIVEE